MFLQKLLTSRLNQQMWHFWESHHHLFVSYVYTQRPKENRQSMKCKAARLLSLHNKPVFLTQMLLQAYLTSVIEGFIVCKSCLLTLVNFQSSMTSRHRVRSASAHGAPWRVLLQHIIMLPCYLWVSLLCCERYIFIIECVMIS